MTSHRPSPRGHVIFRLGAIPVRSIVQSLFYMEIWTIRIEPGVD